MSDPTIRARAARFSWLTAIALDDVLVTTLANQFVAGEVSYDECLQHMIIAMAQRHHALTAALIKAEACKPGPTFIVGEPTESEQL